MSWAPAEGCTPQEVFVWKGEAERRKWKAEKEVDGAGIAGLTTI